MQKTNHPYILGFWTTFVGDFCMGAPFSAREGQMLVKTMLFSARACQMVVKEQYSVIGHDKSLSKQWYSAFGTANIWLAKTVVVSIRGNG